MLSANPIKPRTSRADRVRPFYVMDLLARANQLEAEGRSVLHMEVGEPDFPTPQPVIEAGIRALQAQLTHYTPALGLPELRRAIADYYRVQFDVAIEPRRVIVTPGASGALQLALAVLLDTGDRVLLTDPGYPCNRNMIRLLGADCIDVAVGPESHYQLQAAHIERYWDDSTVAAMIASPSNPTGTMISAGALQSLLDAVAAKGGCLIVDEIYQGLVYDEQNHTALALSESAIVINSFSKFFGMTGWRLGWMVAPEMYVDAADRVAQNLFLAPPTVSQHAALAAFAPETLEILQRRVDIFQQRRDFLLPALRAMGFVISVEPEGAFYIYADCSAITSDAFSWCHDLLEAEGVAVTPGIDFGENAAARHVRFAYTRPVEELECACDRITKYIKKTS
jgi:aspartate/methionine/tyrosine aminotransferase